MECTIHRLVADVAVMARNAVLMVRYRDTQKYDGQAGWFLPDDLLAFGEHPDRAPLRIAMEQAGLKLPNARLSHVESFTGGASRSWHLIFHYVAQMPDRPSVALGANVGQAEWFDVNRLPEPSTVAHEGWALEVLERVLADRAGNG